VDQNRYSYQINDIKQNINFHFEANAVVSKDYDILVIPVPQIQSIKLNLHYPPHLKKMDEIIENTGNATIPEGTHITWNIKTLNTSEVTLIDSVKRFAFNFNKHVQNYQLKRLLLNNFQYNISCSNKQLKDYENLPFSITVLKDAYPKFKLKLI